MDIISKAIEIIKSTTQEEVEEIHSVNAQAGMIEIWFVTNVETYKAYIWVSSDGEIDEDDWEETFKEDIQIILEERAEEDDSEE